MMEQLFTVGLITLIVVFITYLIYIRYLTPGDTLPGPKAWPFLGNLIMVSRAKNFYQLTKDLQKEYGNVFKLKLGQITIVFISGHTNISKVMVDDGENSSHRPTWMFCPKHIFKGKGIVWANGHQWLELNKLIMQAQHETTVIENMQQQLALEVNKLCQCFSPNEATDPLDHFFNSTFNIMSIVAFGKRFEYEEPDFTTLRTKVKYIFKHGQSLGRKETLFSWLALFTKSQVSEVVGEMDKLHALIKRKLENHITDHNSKIPRDLLDVYLNLSETERKDSALSESNFFQAIIDMYIAAYETYTGTMMALVFYLLKYPDVQKKCREEIHRVCRGKQTVTIEDRDELRYVESTIKEVLRIAKPVVLAIYRTNPREIKVEKNTIPAESIILFDLNDPQIDPKLWDRPNEFDPDRWTTPQKNGYLPFGIGPRRCVGAPTVEMSLFFMITNILKKFELIPEDERNLPMERDWTGISLFPKPFKMFMKPVEYYNKA
ncbi:cytochrome P450 2J6-like [Mytilus trossulus]|uniref:cytochrome P450 2J6-like n=1 Tax=Mytilus trossulus TaxID=6551 RepID=UPI003003CBDC